MVNLIAENTEKLDSDIKWQYKEKSGQYTAKVAKNEEVIKLKIGRAMLRVGSLIFLKLSTKDEGIVCIIEPQKGVFNKYDSEDEKKLAEAMKRLLGLASRQNSQRELRDSENEQARRQAIFRKIIAIKQS